MFGSLQTHWIGYIQASRGWTYDESEWASADTLTRELTWVDPSWVEWVVGVDRVRRLRYIWRVVRGCCRKAHRPDSVWSLLRQSISSPWSVARPPTTREIVWVYIILLYSTTRLHGAWKQLTRRALIRFTSLAVDIPPILCNTNTYRSATTYRHLHLHLHNTYLDVYHVKEEVFEWVSITLKPVYHKQLLFIHHIQFVYLIKLPW